MAPVYFNKISLLAFNKTLSRYPSTAPSALTDLDKSRYETIPVKVTKAKTEAHLLKADVEKLVEWKLYVAYMVLHESFHSALYERKERWSNTNFVDTTNTCAPTRGIH